MIEILFLQRPRDPKVRLGSRRARVCCKVSFERGVSTCPIALQTVEALVEIGLHTHTRCACVPNKPTSWEAHAHAWMRAHPTIQSKGESVGPRPMTLV